MHAYATWQVMRRLRASAASGGRVRIYTAHARNNIRAAADFTAWLSRRGRPLQHCRQADADDWLATGPGASQVRDFLTWAAARGHCPALHMPGPARNEGAAASQDQRWALAARLLHDDTLDLTDRAAGCLVLLYGQQLSRIAAMATSQVTSQDGTVVVRFGRHEAPVPGPLGAILTELIRAGRPTRIGQADGRKGWSAHQAASPGHRAYTAQTNTNRRSVRAPILGMSKRGGFRSGHYVARRAQSNTAPPLRHRVVRAPADLPFGPGTDLSRCPH